MKTLLDKIIEATYKANRFFDEDAQKPRPNGPASADDLRRLDAYLSAKKLVAPLSYKSFLSIYNGIPNLLGDSYSLLSIDDVIGENYSLMKEDIDKYPNLCQFVFAAGDTPNFMGFDVSKSNPEHGYEVAEITAEGGELKSKSFEEFLTSLLGNLEETIQGEEKDRENLGP